LDTTELSCVLDREEVCGSWKPVLTTFYGTIPFADDVEDVVIGCTAASYVVDAVNDADTSPGINLLGKDNLEITGTSFPDDLEGNTFSLTFSNTDETTCEVIATSSTLLTCKTGQFDTSTDRN
jgi:hypothetical protein